MSEPSPQCLVNKESIDNMQHIITMQRNDFNAEKASTQDRIDDLWNFQYKRENMTLVKIGVLVGIIQLMFFIAERIS